MSDLHSHASPSNTLALICPASVWLQEMVHKRNNYLLHKFTYLSDDDNSKTVTKALKIDTKAAELGTSLHTIREEVLLDRYDLQAGFDEFDIDDPNDTLFDALSENIEYIKEQWEKAESYGTESHVVNLGSGSGGKIDAYWVIGDLLVGDDLKTGRIYVDAAGNTQLMRYTSALLDALNWPPTIKRVKMRISALRFGDSEWEVTVEDLKHWRDNDLQKAFDRIYSINPEKVPGDHCKNCASQGVNCLDGVPTLFDKMPNEELESFIHTVDNMGDMLSKAKNELMLRLSTGQCTKTKHYELKAGRGRDNYIPNKNVLEAELSAETIIYKPKKLKTKLQLTKLFKTWGNGAALELLDNYDPKGDAKQFKDVCKDYECLYQPRKLKTRKQLETIFAHSKVALRVLKKPQDKWFDELSTIITPNILMMKKEKTPAQIRSILDGEEYAKYVTRTTSGKILKRK